MARLFAAGQFATGIIAVGQIATGVIAIGQVATGVIAIGQVARGGIAIGMAAFGLVAYGMVGVGLVRATAMVGIGGTRGRGFVLPLVPLPARRQQLPRLVTLERLEREDDGGWLAASVRDGPSGVPVFVPEGTRQDSAQRGVRLDVRLRAAATKYIERGPRAALVYVRRVGERLRWDRLMARPDPVALRAVVRAWRVLGFAGLLGLAFVYWVAVAAPIGELLRGAGGLLR